MSSLQMSWWFVRAQTAFSYHLPACVPPRHEHCPPSLPNTCPVVLVFPLLLRQQVSPAVWLLAGACVWVCTCVGWRLDGCVENAAVQHLSTHGYLAGASVCAACDNPLLCSLTASYLALCTKLVLCCSHIHVHVPLTMCFLSQDDVSIQLALQAMDRPERPLGMDGVWYSPATQCGGAWPPPFSGAQQ